MNRLIFCLALIVAPFFAETADARPRLFQRGYGAVPFVEQAPIPHTVLKAVSPVPPKVAWPTPADYIRSAAIDQVRVGPVRMTTQSYDRAFRLFFGR